LSNFFKKEKLLAVKKGILKEKFSKIDKDLFSFSHTKDLASSTEKTVNEFYNLLSSSEFIELMENLSGIKLIKKIDMQSHSFSKGDYLLFHDDDLLGRKIAYIIYLSDFSRAEGGKLSLYDIKKPLNPIKQVIPKFSTFACFKVSNDSLHDVEEVLANKKRITIGGWFYGN
jgi:prolyl 3-hydroxylase /prolyl 3,4-dihydroxylase